MASTIPPKIRDFVAKRAGKWPEFGDLNYPIVEALEAMADYIDMIAAKAFGEDLEDNQD